MKAVLIAYCNESMTERFLKEHRRDEYKSCFYHAFKYTGLVVGEYDHLKYPLLLMDAMDNALYHKNKTFLGKLDRVTEMAMSYVGWEKQLIDFLSNKRLDIGIIHVSTRMKKVYEVIKEFAEQANKGLVKRIPDNDDELGLFWVHTADVNAINKESWDACAGCYPAARKGMTQGDYVDECLDSLDRVLGYLVTDITEEPKPHEWTLSVDLNDGDYLTYSYQIKDVSYNDPFSIGATE